MFNNTSNANASLNRKSNTQTQSFESNFNAQNWANEPNQSVFIKRIPHWFGEDEIYHTMSYLGKISRIHIVDVSPTKGSGRMAFVHYDHWFNNNHSQNVRIEILNSNDNTYVQSVCNPITYEYFMMHLTYNRRPIPRSTYDVDQLTDMINTLNSENTIMKQKMSLMTEKMNYQESVIKIMMEKLGFATNPSSAL